MTGSPASYFSTSSFSDRSHSCSSDNSIYSDEYPPTPPLESSTCSSSSSFVAPRDIPARHNTSSSEYFGHAISTPPLTPDSSVEDDESEAVTTKQSNDALDFLLTIFPHDGLAALAFAKSVAIKAPNMGAAFDGVVLELPGQSKTLYVDGKSAESVSLRESIVALLDLADESLECSALVIALERSSPHLGELLHSLMYVGGTVVTKPPFKVDSAFVLVGLEI